MFNLSAQPWCSQQILSVNRLKPRAWFQPASDEEKALHGDFDRVQCLSGSWDFCYLEETPLDEEAFVQTRNSLPWTSMEVPRSFQAAGFGPRLYTDEDYPFPVQPPLVPALNPTGVYRRFFDLPADDLASVLRLEGAESCASVYVNGAFAGYTQGSRLPAEFEISSLCRPGSNELLILVRQYCDGTYLEDQDMWWLGGLIRDVFLLRRSREGIGDLHVQADYDAASGLGRLLVEGTEGARCRLLDDRGETLWTGKSGEPHTLPVTPWNAEEPVLYTLLVSRGGEAARLRVGFRRVEITEGELRLNGRRLMLRGVNRHEFSPVKGRAVTREETRQDLLRMKQAHINAVRTSHYPNNPFFYELCDELGFYVMDECDLETHGIEIEGVPSRLADDPAWRAAYLDRAERTLCRDRNFACVILWSLANESFRGDNLRAMYDYFRRSDSRPVHYEGDASYAYSDVISTMYTSPGRLAELDAALPGKPMLLCEFAHAMGNGPGGLETYRRIIESSRRIQGYFIWEWRNHGLLRDGGILHGGDTGSAYHSGNFCMDGLLNSDGTPTPGFFSFARMNEPLRISFSDGKLCIRSVFTFHTLRSAIVRLTLKREEELPETWELPLPGVEAGKTLSLPLPQEMLRTPENALYTLQAEIFGPKEELLGQETFVLREYAPSSVKERGPLWQRQGDLLCVADGSVRYAVSLAEGRLRGYSVEGRELLRSGPQLSLYRPAMDNDRRRRSRWTDLHLHSMTPLIRSADLDGSTLVLTCCLGADARLWSVPFELRYTPLPDGHLRIILEGRFEGPFGQGREDLLPRIGTDSLVSPELDRMIYLGFGPGETYCDSFFQARYGWHRSAVKDLAFPYDCPQEAGNRTGCRASALLDAAGHGVALVSRTPCDTSASFYSARTIDAASHPQDLVPEDHIFWRFDLKEAGLGSASCGPEPQEHALVRPFPFRMDFVLLPVRGKSLPELVRKGWDELC